MALHTSQEYKGTLAKFEYSRYKNDIYLNNIHIEFLNYISNAVYKQKDINGIEIHFANFIFKDKYNIVHLDSVYDNRLHMTFRGIDNSLLTRNIIEQHKELLLYVTLMDQASFYRFLFKYKIDTNSITLIENVNILEEIFKYQENILSTIEEPIKHLHLDDFKVIDVYSEKIYPKYENINIDIEDVFNNFQYHQDLKRNHYILNKSFLEIFISITRKRLNIFQYNLLMEREDQIPLLITGRIDIRKKIPMILKGRSLLYYITDYKELTSILPKINDTLRFKLKKT